MARVATDCIRKAGRGVPASRRSQVSRNAQSRHRYVGEALAKVEAKRRINAIAGR